MGATGTGQPEISRIEAGKGNPTQDTLRKLGASLGAVLTFATEDGRPISI
ncbi:MAG: helix-turn-helix domain-containing protein [Dermatophilaceae bacterium]